MPLSEHSQFSRLVCGPPQFIRQIIGARHGIRTHTLLIKSQPYYHYTKRTYWCRGRDSNPYCNAPKAFASFRWATSAKRKRENYFSRNLPINYHFTSCILRGNRNIHLIKGTPLHRTYRTRVVFWSSCHFENGDCIARFVIWEVKGAKSLCVFERVEKTY